MHFSAGRVAAGDSTVAAVISQRIVIGIGACIGACFSTRYVAAQTMISTSVPGVSVPPGSDFLGTLLEVVRIAH